VRERTTLTAVVVAALEQYADDDRGSIAITDGTPGNPLDDLRRHAAELQARIDEAPDEQTARRLADELHALLDDLDNVHALRANLDED
jgi:hypothetical protein